MGVYKVNPFVYGQAIALTLTDLRKKTDAVFLHGVPVIDESLFDLVIAMFNDGQAGKIVINGLPDEMSISSGSQDSYAGSDTWVAIFEKRGIGGILKTLPSNHTASESENILRLAEEHGWESITIVSYPYHILRCMLQIVFFLNAYNVNLKVYARTLSAFDWQMSFERKVLNGESFSGMAWEAHMRQEYDRLVRYADRKCFMSSSGGKARAESAGPDYIRTHTPHATLEELVAYYQRRDKW